jgi:phage-related protein
MPENFPDVSPDLSSSFSRKPKNLRAEFGDGYLQSVADGINPFREVWPLSFTNRPKAQIDAIKALLDATNGNQYFYWTPPEETPLTPTPKKWFMTDEGYAYGKSGPDAYSISFTIERTFNP